MASEDRTAGGMAVVWDLGVRIGHWVLVAAFAVAYLTGGEALEFHEWAGYVVAAYVVCRLIWGFIGSKYALFGDFLYGPRRALTYLRDMVRGRARRYLGHSPAGSFMVFALLIMLAGTVTTGMAELAVTHGEGPFSTLLQARSADRLSQATSLRATGTSEEQESMLREVHELFANLTLVMIALHIVGVLVASIAHRENLVVSMVTGRKQVDPERSD